MSEWASLMAFCWCVTYPGLAEGMKEVATTLVHFQEFKGAIQRSNPETLWLQRPSEVMDVSWGCVGLPCLCCIVVFSRLRCLDLQVSDHRLEIQFWFTQFSCISIQKCQSNRTVYIMCDFQIRKNDIVSIKWRKCTKLDWRQTILLWSDQKKLKKQKRNVEVVTYVTANEIKIVA